MPGAYAHLTLVGELAASNVLNKASGFTDEARAAVLRNTCYCDLGAVSPDYPYLKVTDKYSAHWADLMHYEKTGNMVKIGVQEVSKLTGADREKAFAWLLGYTAHVVTDMTIHPVVQEKVGPYEQNQTAHRICEMNQDAYIFQRLNIGAIGLSEYLDSGIRLCSSKHNTNKLDPCISALWRKICSVCHASEYQKNAPDIDGWHSWFINTVDKVEEGARLPAFARHVAAGQGLTYPNVEEIDQQYIAGLKTPVEIMHYDAIFEHAKNNVTNMWSAVAAGVFKNEKAYQTLFGDWNLDTGLNAQKKLVFWGKR